MRIPRAVDARFQAIFKRTADVHDAVDVLILIFLDCDSDLIDSLWLEEVFEIEPSTVRHYVAHARKRLLAATNQIVIETCKRDGGWSLEDLGVEQLVMSPAEEVFQEMKEASIYFNDSQKGILSVFIKAQGRAVTFEDIAKRTGLAINTVKTMTSEIERHLKDSQWRICGGHGKPKFLRKFLKEDK